MLIRVKVSPLDSTRRSWHALGAPRGSSFRASALPRVWTNRRAIVTPHDLDSNSVQILWSGDNQRRYGLLRTARGARRGAAGVTNPCTIWNKINDFEFLWRWHRPGSVGSVCTTKRQLSPRTMRKRNNFFSHGALASADEFWAGGWTRQTEVDYKLRVNCAGWR